MAGELLNLDLGSLAKKLFFEKGIKPSDLWSLTPFEFDHLLCIERPKYDTQTPGHLKFINDKLRNEGKKPLTPHWFLPKVPSARRKIKPEDGRPKEVSGGRRNHQTRSRSQH